MPQVNNFKTNAAGVNLIKEFEGIKDGNKRKPLLQPYLAPEGQWTTGYGHVLRPGVDDWMKEGITESQAVDILKSDLVPRENWVNKNVTVPINENEFAALVSLVFNVGEANIKRSTLLRLLNNRRGNKDNDYERLIAAEFLKWDKYTNPKTKKKESLAGLTRRRQAESRLYMTEPIVPAKKDSKVGATVGTVLFTAAGGAVEYVKPVQDTVSTIEQVAQPTNEKLKSNGLDFPPLGGILIFLALLSAGAALSKIFYDKWKARRERGVTA